MISQTATASKCLRIAVKTTWLSSSLGELSRGQYSKISKQEENRNGCAIWSSLRSLEVVFTSCVFAGLTSLVLYSLLTFLVFIMLSFSLVISVDSFVFLVQTFWGGLHTNFVWQTSYFTNSILFRCDHSARLGCLSNIRIISQLSGLCWPCVYRIDGLLKQPGQERILYSEKFGTIPKQTLWIPESGTRLNLAESRWTSSLQSSHS